MPVEYMTFDIKDFAWTDESMLAIIEMPSVEALQAFVHMASVDHRPIPIFKYKMPTSYFYFCLFEGAVIHAGRNIEPEPVKVEEVADGMAVSPPV